MRAVLEVAKQRHLATPGVDHESARTVVLLGASEPIYEVHYSPRIEVEDDLLRFRGLIRRRGRRGVIKFEHAILQVTALARLLFPNLATGDCQKQKYNESVAGKRRTEAPPDATCAQKFLRRRLASTPIPPSSARPARA